MKIHNVISIPLIKVDHLHLCDLERGCKSFTLVYNQSTGFHLPSTRPVAHEAQDQSNFESIRYSVRRIISLHWLDNEK